ncbi:Epithelial-stromal interaction protein 1 [Collichthys lucidus]|uniref:Epithelial-stromal interaction protein 1 n=1 Tax=Collichthys lucidus TaxID=240159 RepID=A0A4U5U1D9_COLLU|nr:Epithelial-stromal interaction protein 1 [Collichthys lucidus]
MEDLQRWKEANKVPHVNLNPERLGGDVTLAEARQKQYTDQRFSKVQKKLRKEELDKKRRQEEEEKLQKMKNEKRELAEYLEERSRQEEQRRREKHRQDHLRVNSAFLDKLEGRGGGSENETKGRGIRQAEDPCFASESFRDQSSNKPGQQLHLAYLDPDPEQSCSSRTEEADPEVDYDWALMKLMNSFPDCARVFLEDILDQCNGDYEQACTLLISS